MSTSTTTGSQSSILPQLPRQATADDYLQIQKRLGTTRTVIVQPTNYGTDNRVTLDAIARPGLDKTRGIAVISTDISEKELLALHQGGIRGVRFSLRFEHGAQTCLNGNKCLA